MRPGSVTDGAIATSSARGSLRPQRPAVTAVEVDPSERPPIIAAYRAKWESRPGVRPQFMQMPDSADHPVFRLSYQR